MQYIFRGLTIAEKKWLYGHHLVCDDQHFIIEAAVAISYAELNRVLPASVGMCTGLKDISKKDIYGNDIVRAGIYGDDEVITNVYYADGGFLIDFKDGDADCFFIGDFPGQIVVIGNLAENPELLSGEQI